MRKLSAFLLITISGIFLYTARNINDIQTVSYTNIVKIPHCEFINAGGEFESTAQTSVVLSYPVCIKDVYVQPNRYVNRGQALFSLDLDKMSRVAAGNIDREILNSVDYKDLSGLKSAEKNIDLSRIQETVYAPEAGFITEMNIYPGAVALQNKHLIKISHTDEIIARFSLTQKDYGKVKIGDKVEINSVAFSDNSYYGKISDKNAVVRKQTSAAGNKVVVDVFAHIENPDKNISAGLQINGKIQSGEEKTIKAIDYTFINQDDKGEFVYILYRGTAKKVYIETGTETENHTELLTPFRMDTVFLSGNIKEGSRVILSE